jgi:hypothetical protein
MLFSAEFPCKGDFKFRNILKLFEKKLKNREIGLNYLVMMFLLLRFER